MRRWRIWTLLLFTLALALGAGLALSGNEQAPEQPIAFSHKIHAGEYQIACEYCHVFARRAAVAGIPSVERCMGCHKITGADKPEVQKLQQYWNRKEPIAWVKVTGMPDFTYFEHWPHVRSGIACQACHGPVESMEQTVQVKDLTMADCLACHRERQASLDCLICHR
jgi:hypothetical protein